MVERLLDNKADAETLDVDKNTLMHYAVASKHKELVRSLVHRKVNVEGKNKYGYRPLHVAAAEGDVAMVKILVEEGNAKVNIKTNQHFIVRETKTPLFIALEKGQYEIARYLVEKGADVNALNDSQNSTALTQACRNDHLPMVRFLLEHGANPNGIENYYYFPLALARSQEVVNILVKFGAEVNPRRDNLTNPTSALRTLVESIESDELKTKQRTQKLEALKALIIHGASLNDGNPVPLESAAKCKEVVEVLMEARKRTETSSSTEPLLKANVANIELGKSLLELAKECDTRGRLEAFTTMLRDATKDDVHYAGGPYNDNAETILHRIVASARYSDYRDEHSPQLSDYVEAVRLLLEKGADPNAVETLHHETTLHKAAKVAISGYEKAEDIEQIKVLLKLLISYGANPHMTNEEAQTPAMILALDPTTDFSACLKK